MLIDREEGTLNTLYEDKQQEMKNRTLNRLFKSIEKHLVKNYQRLTDNSLN